MVRTLRTPSVRPLAAALIVLGACAHAGSSSQPAAPGAIALPTPGAGPIDPQGWRVPGSAYGLERDRCIDRELARRELNEYGDPRGTSYEGGAPVGVATVDDRYRYVLRHRPDIAVQCTRAPGEPDR